MNIILKIICKMFGHKIINLEEEQNESIIMIYKGRDKYNLEKYEEAPKKGLICTRCRFYIHLE